MGTAHLSGRRRSCLGRQAGRQSSEWWRSIPRPWRCSYLAGHGKRRQTRAPPPHFQPRMGAQRAGRDHFCQSVQPPSRFLPILPAIKLMLNHKVSAHPCPTSRPGLRCQVLNQHTALSWAAAPTLTGTSTSRLHLPSLLSNTPDRKSTRLNSSH